MHIVLKRYMPRFYLRGVSDLKIHIVQKGDTIWDIAKQYGVDFEELKQLNSHLSSPDMIMPGMKIKIPSTAKQVKTTEPKETKTKIDKTEQKQMPQQTANNYQLNQLQQPHLGEQTLHVQPKIELSEEKKSEKMPQPVQMKPEKMEKQQIGISTQNGHLPLKQMPQQQFTQSSPSPYGHAIPVQPHPPCCCYCQFMPPSPLHHVSSHPMQHHGNVNMPQRQHGKYIFNQNQ